MPSPEALAALATALSGFSDDVLDRACAGLEQKAIDAYEPRMPTLSTLESACRAAASGQKRTRWCGRCRMGLVRGSDGEIRYCPCDCALCHNSGWTTERRDVPKMPYAKASYAVRCPHGCAVTGSEAA